MAPDSASAVVLTTMLMPERRHLGARLAAQVGLTRVAGVGSAIGETDYSTDEINSAVEKVLGAQTRQTPAFSGHFAGNTSFDELHEAAAGVFALQFNAPFYVVFLGAQRLNELIQAQSALVTDFVSSLTDPPWGVFRRRSTWGRSQVRMQP